MKATWNGETIAESDNTIVVEGNHYFPPDSIKDEFYKANSNDSVCPWKGTASYYDLNVAGKENPDAAWYYANPKEAANNIKGYVAFWRGVEISE